MYLFEEFFQVGTALVVYPCTWKETAAIACFENTDTEINILAETHAGKSA